MLGAESLNPLTPITTLLNYGPIDEAGNVNVHIHYDHRVMDGATIARALNTTLTGELKAMIETEAVRLPM